MTNGVVPGFDRAATGYDRLVAMNPGYHRHLRLSAARLGLADGAGLRLLDLGCGTGASTAAMLAVYPRAEIVALDASAPMLARARSKPWPASVSFVHAPAEELTAAGIEGPFDGVLAAYLLRNLPDPDVTLRDVRRLLKPGGTLAVHEYSVADSPMARVVWTAVCWSVIVPSGLLLSGDAGLYRYLWRSVMDFDGVRALSARLRRTGFQQIDVLPTSGWQRGITHTFLASVPADPADHTTRRRPDQRHRWSNPGRDRRAVRYPPRPGVPDATSLARKPRVAVIGGGIGGLAAAVTLAERGVEVELFERESYLGGRVGGWPTVLADGSEVTMSRGFHAFFRQYYNLRSLLRRAGGGGLTPLRDYPLVQAAGWQDRFTGLVRTPPWNALHFVARSPTFRWRDLARTNPRAALPLLDVSVPRIYRHLDHLDATTFLRRIGFPEKARALAFSVFSRSFFAEPDRLSAAELATMFHLYFVGSSEGLPFDVPDQPFPQALWDPLEDYLRALGVDIHRRSAVERIAPRTQQSTGEADGRRFVVHTAGVAPTPVDAVVLACDVDGLRNLVGSSGNLGDPGWRCQIEALRTAPPFAVSRFWLDRPVGAHRPGFLGTAGFGSLDNVSVLERYESQARRWARRAEGSVVELHAYALPSGTDPLDLRGRLLEQLHRVYPETGAAAIVDERHEVRDDCPLFAPGTFEQRPTVRTPDPFVVVAGDLVRVDLPVALMERAATSGILAANALLEQWGVAGGVLWSVPNTGRLRPWLPFGRTKTGRPRTETR